MLRLQKHLLPLHRSASPIHLSLQRTLLSISAAAASSSPGHISAEDYLVTTCGLAREDAAKAAKCLNWKSPAKADAVLAFLTGPGLGLSKAEIALLVTKDPRILSSSVENTLRARLEGFRSHGFSTAQIRSFVCRAPFALRRFNIDEKLSFWMSFMGSPEKFLPIIKRNYYLFSSDLDKVVKTNIRLLRERGLSTGDIGNMCASNPRLLTCNPETTRAILVRADELGVPQNTHMFRQAVNTVASLHPEMMASKLEMMRKIIGCSNSEVATMVQTNPLVLQCSKEKFQRVHDFLTKVVGVDAKYILGRSKIMTYSLERRLAPRNYVMKVLQEKGLIRKNLCFYSLSGISEKLFYSRYIHPYKDFLPGLANAYSSACKGEITT